MKRIGGVLLAIAFLANGTAFAGPSGSTLWTSSGSGCVIDPASTSLAAWTSSVSRVTFSGNNTGTIVLVCPITAFHTVDSGYASPDRWNIVFYDTDGTTDTCSVSMALVTQSTSSTDSGYLVTQYDGTADGSLASSPYRNSETSTFSESWDFDNYFYYFKVDLVRGSTGCNATLVGLTLGTPVSSP